jgi:hypothetical protein
VRYVILPCLQVGACPSTTCGCAGAATGVAPNDSATDATVGVGGVI